MTWHVTWPVSAGRLFEWLLPTAFALVALLSTWTFAHARRSGFRTTAAFIWALGTLTLPPVAFPLYLLACLYARPPASDINTAAAANAPPDDQGEAVAPDTDNAEDIAADSDYQVERNEAAAAASLTATPRRLPRPPHALTVAYALMLLTFGALYFVHDYRSLDATLARASDATLRQQHARAADEYRAALALADNAHTHKLLGLELLADRRYDEALREFRAAFDGGEPDDRLPFFTALALDALGRAAEAEDAYRAFDNSSACTQALPDVRCVDARARLQAKTARP